MSGGTLSAAELADVRAHLEACARCREAAARATLERQLFGFDDERHLDDEQLAAYVDGRVDAADREIAETHLEHCADCRRLIDEIRRPVAPPRRSRWLLAVAAGTLLVLLAGAMYFLMRRTTPSPDAPVVVDTALTGPATVTETTATAPRSYGRADWDALVREALATGVVAAPAIIGELSGPPDPLRGSSKPAQSSLSPAATAIDATRPEFQWRTDGDAEAIVAIARGDEEILRSAVLRQTRWTPSRDLTRDQTYSWTVELRRSDGTRAVLPPPSEPMALFRVLSAAEHEEWAAAQRSGDPLLRGLVAARLGLRAEATRELSRYAEQHPESAAAARLRDSLAAWPGAAP
jgi:Putative zinc-finger